MKSISYAELNPLQRVGSILFLAVLVASSGLSIYTEEIALLAVPALLLGIATVILMPRVFPIIYFMTLPYSMEISFSDSLGTDLPSEPLLLLMTGLALIHLLWRSHIIDKGLLTHPVSILLYIHLSWILLSTLTSTHGVISLKFLAAKSWYIGALYLLPVLWYSWREIMSLSKYMIYSTIPLALFVLIKHAQSGFGFVEANTVMAPFFRNHVTYAVFFLFSLPFCWWHYREARETNVKYRWIGITLFFCIALYFNYTRIAHIGMVLLPVAYIIMRYNLTKIFLISALATVIGLATWLTTDRNFVKLAPDYSTTIAHKNFEDLLEATLKGKDVSSMERVYRWVAAGFMVAERPVMGFGPGTFYENYRPYTVLAFRTYVSNNEERSGIHNYFLMLFVEQGLVGLLIFLTLWVYALLRAERLANTLPSASGKALAAVIYMTMISIGLVHLLNDLIETDKVGTFFFISLAVLVILDVNRHTLPK